ncbi:superfamily II DNA and RNA helicase (plasmid) [Clostridium botulinum Af84]|uniref:Eco57I restriction-modification methylase domain-containing protein n=1 Tax=Clostridium botulinum TaxID=1491 RepID=UPI00035BA111|nr:superfamily II DNA and RNA helicase [Clostridium botulinum]APR02806.1 eco57I restriction-modification methylase family protein [Clostridium botulinum]EPS54492.1 superfamily II DNA and RNA helicase [Clostridium botulinum Af84]
MSFITQSLFDFLDKGKEILHKTKEKSKKKKLTKEKSQSKVAQIDFFNLNPDITKNNKLKDEKFELKQIENNSILTRIKNNIIAIKLAKKLKQQVRKADMFEKDLISQYSGWGGLQDLFQQNKYIKEREKIEELLTEEEYRNALSSINTSFYTNKSIISFMYNALKKMGFKHGRVLEPSCGIGNFIGYMPQDIKSDSNIIGIEKEGLAASIAAQLYQNTEIQNTGFENARILDNYFDVVVGNVPFGNIKVHDKNYNKYALSIHNYFIVKSLDKVRLGGIVALITSSFTMGSKTNKVREIIGEKANLIAAIKLPNIAFGNTNTTVVSDILILQKKLENHTESNLSKWLQVNNEINEYFSNNPKMIAGHIKEISGPFGKTYTVELNGNLEEKLNEILEYIPQKIYKEIAIEEKDVIWADDSIIEDEYVVLNNKLYQNNNGILVEQKLSSSSITFKRITNMIALKNQVQHIINIQLDDCSDDVLKEEQLKLNTIYDKFVLSYGYINSTANSRAYNKDSYYNLISSIEIVENDKISKRDIFTKRTIQLPKVVTKADSIEEAYYITLGEKGKLDFSRIASLVSKSEKEVIGYLNGKLIFFNPATEQWETEDNYLSGNVRKKLNLAKQEYKFDQKFQVNVQALEKVQPAPITAEDITVNFGATWVPKDIYKDFILYTLEAKAVDVEFNKIDASWEISVYGCPYSILNYKYGTERKNAIAVIAAGLNLKVPNVYDTIIDPDTDKKKRVLNAKESMLAIQKLEEIEIEFNNWIFKDLNRRKRLEELYNQMFNSIIPRRYNGDHLIFPYKNPNIKFRSNQLKAIARCLTGNSTLLAHCVGAGKTYIMTATAIRLKQMKIISKPLFSIPNALVESGQFSNELHKLYPHAKILSATSKDFTKQNRKKLISKIALFDWDAIILGHSSFDRISVSKERQEKYIEKEIEEIEEYISQMGEDEKISIRKLEKMKENL